MSKITWKVINGCGPYAYLQGTERVGATVHSPHIRYLGKIGSLSKAGIGEVLPGREVELPTGETVVVPALPRNVEQRLKPSHGQAALSAVAGGSVASQVYNDEEIQLEWDDDKRATILRERHLDFDDVRLFEWSTAMYYPQIRGGEPQHKAIGLLGGRLHVVVYTERDKAIRVFSLRPASRRERRDYV